MMRRLRRYFWPALFVGTVAMPAWAQDAVPEIPYESVPNFLKMPADVHLGEATGVAGPSLGFPSSSTPSGTVIAPAIALI